MEEPVVNKEDQISMALVAHEVGFETIELIVDYYNKMLVACILLIAKANDESPSSIRMQLEEELGLSNVMEGYITTLQAAVEYNKFLLDEEE